MVLDFVHEIHVAHNPEIKAPCIVYAGLPKIAPFVELFGVERWVMQVPEQEL
jgi:hypothetical protein